MSCQTKKLKYNRTIFIGSLIMLIFFELIGGCSLKKISRELIPPENITSSSSNSSTDGSLSEEDNLYLKVHMQNGAVYTFTSWTVDSNAYSVTGEGKLFDAYRVLLDEGTFTVDIDSVAIFETNKLVPSSAIAPMSIITGISAAATFFCITNPKACFGSCPTIYVQEGNSEILQAECFSSSIAPSLEDTDIDKLRNFMTTDKTIQLIVRNEALETHVIRSMDLLAVPKNSATQVYLGIDGEFYETNSPIQPISCMDESGDYLREIQYFDGIERFSSTDSTDLSKRETLDLKFENPDCERVGLIIGCRQTLLSTYLLYSGLEFLGTQVGSWMAEMERGNRSVRNSAGGMGRFLGGIDVKVQNQYGDYILIGSVNETGPLASDMHLVPLPIGLTSSEKRIQLELTKGHWRIDYLALVCLENVSNPITINPTHVFYESSIDLGARQKLLDSALTLVTFPGDEYVIEYELPGPANSYDLFVKSRGYYLEWIRDEWVAGEDLTRAAEIFFAPNEALRKFAPEFKKVEASMENIFWNSKYVK